MNLFALKHQLLKNDADVEVEKNQINKMQFLMCPLVLNMPIKYHVKRNETYSQPGTKTHFLSE